MLLPVPDPMHVSKFPEFTKNNSSNSNRRSTLLRVISHGEFFDSEKTCL